MNEHSCARYNPRPKPTRDITIDKVGKSPRHLSDNRYHINYASNGMNVISVIYYRKQITVHPCNPAHISKNMNSAPFELLTLG